MIKLTSLFLFLYLYLAEVSHRAKGVFSLCIARGERDAKRLREDWGRVRCSTPITLSSVLFLRRLKAFVLFGGLGEGIFETLSERKMHALKLVINLTRLPGRHGGGQCDRTETRIEGENQPHDQPNKLEGVRGEGESSPS